MDLTKLFYTPVWRSSLNISNPDLANIKDYCLGLSKEAPSRRLSNAGGWQSDEFNYADLQGTPLEPLLDLISDKLQWCMKEMGSDKETVFDNIWINISYQNNYNWDHVHSGIFGGVFYVTFPDPEATMFFTREYDKVNFYFETMGTDWNNEITAKKIDYLAADNTLIIFPTWVPHGVRPNKTNQPRISIAFNTILKSESSV